MGQAHIPHFVLVGGVFFAAGLVKGTLGMGLPTLAMGLLGLVMPVPQAAALITLPSLVTNVWQACAGRALRALLARLWSMLAGIAAGVATAAWLPWHDEGFARVLLGVCLLAYGVSGWAGRRLPAVPARWQRVAGAAAGALTGLVTGVTGVFVLPAVPYLQSLQLDRHALPQALALSFTTSTLALAALLAVRGDLGMAASLGSALALVPALLGMWVGQKLRDGMSEPTFRRCFFGGLVLLGAWLAVQDGA
jgi:uncharacterized membrane protein YfcA